MTTTPKVRARTRHPELAKPEYARVYWHHGRYHYRSRRGLPMIVLGTDLARLFFAPSWPSRSRLIGLGTPISSARSARC